MSIRVHPAELHKQSLTSSGRAVNLLVSGADGSDFCLIKLHRESLFLHETMSSVMFVYSRTFLYSWETFRSSSPEDLKKKKNLSWTQVDGLKLSGIDSFSLSGRI